METKRLRTTIDKIVNVLDKITIGGDDILGVSISNGSGHGVIQLTEKAFRQLFDTYTISDFIDGYIKLSVKVGATEVMALRKDKGAQDG